MFDSGPSTTHAWYHTTDWHYRRGVPVHGTKHECSIQVSRRPMHGITPLTGITVVGSPCTEQNTSVRFRSVDDPCMVSHHWLALPSWGPRTRNKTRVFDSGQSTTHVWYPTTDWRYRRGVPVHGTKHECSIQVSRRPMHGITPLTGVTVVGSPYTEQNTSVRISSVDDPCMASHH